MSTVRSVCIIDNDKIYTFGIKKIIKNHLPENEVLTYENGQEALEAIREMFENNNKLPDMILLDINMPKMNGWDFLKEFEELRSRSENKTQVFIISSQVSKDKEELYKVEWDEKVSEFIQKPVNVEVLREILAEFIPNRHHL